MSIVDPPTVRFDLRPLWSLSIILLCVATCDDCSGCRTNAKSLYCEPTEARRMAVEQIHLEDT